MATVGKSWAGSGGTIAKESQKVPWLRKEEIQPAFTSQICKEWKFLRSVMKSLREIQRSKDKTSRLEFRRSLDFEEYK